MGRGRVAAAQGIALGIQGEAAGKNPAGIAADPADTVAGTAVGIAADTAVDTAAENRAAHPAVGKPEEDSCCSCCWGTAGCLPAQHLKASLTT